MKKLFVLLLAFASLMILACNSCTQPPPVPVTPAAPGPVIPPAPFIDAAPPPAPVDEDACAAAEAAAKALGCPLAPTRGGVSWTTVCRANALNGNDMHADRIVSAPDCPTIATWLTR